jgi:hypothetical protein
MKGMEKDKKKIEKNDIQNKEVVEHEHDNGLKHRSLF